MLSCKVYSYCIFAIAAALICQGCVPGASAPAQSPVQHENPAQSSNEQQAPSERPPEEQPPVETPVEHAPSFAVDATAPTFLPPELGMDKNTNAMEIAPFIETYSIDAQVNGTYARVTTEMDIRNPNNRVFEGMLNFPLPENATITGFAINVNSEDIRNEMVEASVVDKNKARKAYESEVKKGIDPGLIEQVRGNAFQTHIYPIFPHSFRTVRISYTMPLLVGVNGDTVLPLPMVKSELKKRNIHISVNVPGAPKPVVSGLGSLEFENAQTQWVLDKTGSHLTPTEDLLIAMPELPEIISSVEVNEDLPDETFFSISVKTGEITQPQEPRDTSHLRIIWDASGSRAKEDIAAARAVLTHIPENGNYDVYVLRNTLEPSRQFSTRDELLEFIDTIDIDGGTFYDRLNELAQTQYDGVTLFFTDGIDTYNNAVPELGNNSIGIVSGKMRDTSILKHICHGETIDLNNLSPDEAYQEIVTPQPRVAKVSGKHISDIQGIGISSPGRLTVTGRLNTSSDNVAVELSNGMKYKVNLSTQNISTGRVLSTAWAGAKIRELSPLQITNRDQLIELGKRYRIVSPVTSMIVLESLSQWVEYDIEPPKSLTEIHQEWSKIMEEKALRRSKKQQEYENDWQQRIESLWKSRVAWWKDPIPKNIHEEVVCIKQKNENISTDCQIRHLSAFGLHYAEKFIPPEGWECTEANHCKEQDYYPNDSNLRARSAGHIGQPSVSLSDSGIQFSSDDYETVETEIEIKEWDPDVPYLKTLKDKKSQNASAEELYAAYLEMREDYKDVSTFYFDISEFFFREKLTEYGIRILSNLLELRIDDEGLLRVYAWRLRNAGALDEAIEIARKVTILRPFEPLSWYDLAFSLGKRAKATMNADDVTEALQTYYKTIFDPSFASQNRSSIALLSLEEFNALISWSNWQKWPKKKPIIPKINKFYLKNLDTDLRIVITWETDDTDIDLHVLEPTTEHIYYGHKNSIHGGNISRDITGGYGPEEYMIKKAPAGEYTILTNYYASHQQSLIGASNIRATVYSNWGRPNQTEQNIAIRMDEIKPYKPNRDIFEDANIRDDKDNYYIGKITVK